MRLLWLVWKVELGKVVEFAIDIRTHGTGWDKIWPCGNGIADFANGIVIEWGSWGWGTDLGLGLG